MRRRKLFTLAAGVSAVLCAAVCVLWVRSYLVADCLYWQGWEDEGDRSYWRPIDTEFEENLYGNVNGTERRPER